MNWQNLKVKLTSASQRQLLMILLLIGIVLGMTGCASSTKSSEIHREQAPTSAMVKYSPPTPLEGKTGKLLGLKIIELGILYNSCRADHSTLVDWINGN